MRSLKILFAVVLIGAAPVEVPAGKFETWLAFKKMPLDFTSDGVTVHVEAMPCAAQPTGDNSCHWDGYNNQASVSVSAPGVTPLSVTTNSQSMYARIAVVWFDRHDARPGVIIESQSGGSGGGMTAQLLVPSGGTYRALALGGHTATLLQGRIEDYPRDLSGDGLIDLKLEDGAFDSVFGCNACTPRPPKLFAVRDGRVIDESRDPALRNVFVADMRRLESRCKTTARYRNGACAAYVADAARAGLFKPAWAAMMRHYEHGADVWRPCNRQTQEQRNRRPGGGVRCFPDFPDSLHAFLMRAGYLESGLVQVSPGPAAGID